MSSTLRVQKDGNGNGWVARDKILKHSFQPQHAYPTARGYGWTNHQEGDLMGDAISGDLIMKIVADHLSSSLND